VKTWNLTRAVNAGMMASAAMAHATFENTATRGIRGNRKLARKMKSLARRMGKK
jgi:hypothetical protein